MFREDGSLPTIEPGDDFGACAEIIASEWEEEFAFFPFVDADVVEEAALARFMPMGLHLETESAKHDFLLPKLHLERCLLDPRTVRITKTARRESRRYMLSVNRGFRNVLASCERQHGSDWLVGDLVVSMIALHEQRAVRRAGFISVELWLCKDDGPALVAGEIGYLIGSAYASLTGYSVVSGAGTVQLAALGRLLAAVGVKVWDLGMEIDYKIALGARILSRSRFMPILSRAYADTSRSGALGLLGVSRLVPTRELIDGGGAAIGPSLEEPR
jgi:Leu/Phe-tRNA-protein transferase